MKELSNETKMSISEVANIFQVTPEAIKKHVRKLYPDLISNGLTTYLNQEQITAIKRQMQPTTGVVASVNTDYEMMQKAAEVMSWMQFKMDEQARAISEMTPKAEFADQVAASDSCYSMAETVKVLKLTLGRTKFFALLRADKILMSNNEPYQSYIADGYFKTELKQIFADNFKPVTLVTGKGLQWLAKKYDYLRLKEIV